MFNDWFAAVLLIVVCLETSTDCQPILTASFRFTPGDDHRSGHAASVCVRESLQGRPRQLLSLVQSSHWPRMHIRHRLYGV